MHNIMRYFIKHTLLLISYEGLATRQRRQRHATLRVDLRYLSTEFTASIGRIKYRQRSCVPVCTVSVAYIFSLEGVSPPSDRLRKNLDPITKPRRDSEDKFVWVTEWLFRRDLGACVYTIAVIKRYYYMASHVDRIAASFDMFSE